MSFKLAVRIQAQILTHAIIDLKPLLKSNYLVSTDDFPDTVSNGDLNLKETKVHPSGHKWARCNRPGPVEEETINPTLKDSEQQRQGNI